MTDVDKGFIPIRANYDSLTAYKKSECIYDVTFHFAHAYLSKGDRTIDQMIQAARRRLEGGKQNIAEGIEAGATSKETGIKLVNVARASLQELLLDYKDYLRVRNLEQWNVNSEKGIRCRRVCAQQNDSAYYRAAIQKRNDTAIANIAITLIFQCDKLLRGLIEHLKTEFLEKGGIKEEMARARLEARKDKYGGNR